MIQIPSELDDAESSVRCCKCGNALEADDMCIYGP